MNFIKVTMIRHMRKMRLAAVSLLLLTAFPAFAVLNDPAYWNLWATTDSFGDPLSPGDGEVAMLCGTAVCSGTGGFGIFRHTDQEVVTGTGLIQPIMRWNDNGETGNTEQEIEQAWNTDYRAGPPTSQLGQLGLIHGNDDPLLLSAENQAKDGNGFTKAIKFSDFAVTEVAGVEYFAFIVDINQDGTAEGGALRWDELSFMVSSTNELSDYNVDLDNGDGTLGGFVETDGFTALAETNMAGGCGFDFDTGSAPGADCAKTVWNMDFDQLADNGTGFGGLITHNDAAPNQGSGRADVEVLIERRLFAEAIGFANGDAYITMYTTNGEVTIPFAGGPTSDDPPSDPLPPCDDSYDPIDCNAEANTDFEEVFVRTTDTPMGCVDCGDFPGGDMPEPGTAFLFGLGLAGLLGARRRKQAQAQ